MKNLNTFIVERLKLNKDTKAVNFPLNYEKLIENLMNLDTKFGKPVQYDKSKEYKPNMCVYIPKKGLFYITNIVGYETPDIEATMLHIDSVKWDDGSYIQFGAYNLEDFELKDDDSGTMTFFHSVWTNRKGFFFNEDDYNKFIKLIDALYDLKSVRDVYNYIKKENIDHDTIL